MSNIDKYTQAFTATFEIEASETNGLKYQDIGAWDSAGHMGLIAALEESFDVMLDPDDIIDLSSFEKGKEILRKYDVEI
jgi:acyl carrier protein